MVFGHRQKEIDRWNGKGNETFFDAKTPFDGPAYDHERDWEHLNKQMRAIYSIMKGGEWHTLQDIEDLTGYPQASISAQLRAFRRPKFGGHTVERAYVRNGLHKYRLVLAASGDAAPKRETIKQDDARSLLSIAHDLVAPGSGISNTELWELQLRARTILKRMGMGGV